MRGHLDAIEIEKKIAWLRKKTAIWYISGGVSEIFPYCHCVWNSAKVNTCLPLGHCLWNGWPEAVLG